MKRSIIHITLFFAVFAAALLIVSWQGYSSRGQTQSLKSDSTVKPTVLLTNRDAESDKVWSGFAPAAAQNATLQNDLAWTFGGKAQHGWYLYDLLIRQSVSSPGDAASNGFAGAIAGWQKHAGLSDTGVLDETSLMALIAQWQGSRLKDKSPALPENLIMAPSSDFYDPERLPELRQVERQTYAAYKRMLAAAEADPALNLAHLPNGDLAPTEKYFKIVSAFRTREYQEQLRRNSPGAGSAGLALNSPHFTGRALDLYVGGDPVDTKDANRAIQVRTPVYQWLVRNAEKFGFRPYFYEPWHWEYVK